MNIFLKSLDQELLSKLQMFYYGVAQLQLMSLLFIEKQVSLLPYKDYRENNINQYIIVICFVVGKKKAYKLMV